MEAPTPVCPPAAVDSAEPVIVSMLEAASAIPPLPAATSAPLFTTASVESV